MDRADYHEFTLNLNEASLKTAGFDLDNCLIHELLHIKLYPYLRIIRSALPDNQLRNMFDKLEETIVTELSNVIGSRTG